MIRVGNPHAVHAQSRLQYLRLGPHRFDLLFWRDGGATKFEVLRDDPKIVECTATDGCFDRMRAWAVPTRHAMMMCEPGRTGGPPAYSRSAMRCVIDLSRC
jgi:hypothetical protein